MCKKAKAFSPEKRKRQRDAKGRFCKRVPNGPALVAGTFSSYPQGVSVVDSVVKEVVNSETSVTKPFNREVSLEVTSMSNNAVNNKVIDVTPVAEEPGLVSKCAACAMTPIAHYIPEKVMDLIPEKIRPYVTCVPTGAVAAVVAYLLYRKWTKGSGDSAETSAS